MFTEIINYLFKIFGAILAAFAVAFGLYFKGKEDKKNEIELNNERKKNEDAKNISILKSKISNMSDDRLNDSLRRKEDLY